MLRHLDLLDAGCLDARTYVHTHRHTHDWALGSRSIWFFEIVETDWAILLDSTEGLNIVRSAAKQTSPHTHTHTLALTLASLVPFSAGFNVTRTEPRMTLILVSGAEASGVLIAV